MKNRIRPSAARLLRGLCAAALAVHLVLPRAVAQEEGLTEEEASAQYVSNLRRLLEHRVLPDLTRGILEISASRPPALTVDVTSDASPYSIGSDVASDGSLIVRLSVGYLTLHDAALDAVALPSVLDNPQALNRYLMYQLGLARENRRRGTQGGTSRRAKTFAEFIGLNSQVARRIVTERAWRLSRDRIEVESVGWVVAHLLVRADPQIAGTARGASGAGAARLAAASGWFPVPPIATALGIAAIERSSVAPFEEHAVLCDAASLMAAGLSAMSASTQARATEPDATASSRLTDIHAQIVRLRRHGRCAADAVTVMVAPSPSRALPWSAPIQNPPPLM